MERDQFFHVVKTNLWHFNSHAHVERDSTHIFSVLSSLQFQLTRSRGAWLLSISSIWRICNFNSHAHVERDQFFHVVKTNLWHFNSHAHVERDSTHIFSVLSSLQFQLTRSRGAWLLSISSIWRICNFNSHAHVERDWNILTAEVKLEISTHTLTWSVTWLHWIFFPYHNNFNSHAHVERDQGLCNWQAHRDNFNSHAHVERDGYVRKYCQNYIISTHTLTWSVTISADVKTVNNFISTHTLTWSVTC